MLSCILLAGTPFLFLDRSGAELDRLWRVDTITRVNAIDGTKVYTEDGDYFKIQQTPHELVAVLQTCPSEQR